MESDRTREPGRVSFEDRKDENKRERARLIGGEREQKTEREREIR